MREWVPPDAMVSLAAEPLAAEYACTGLPAAALAKARPKSRRCCRRGTFFVFAIANPGGGAHGQTVDGGLAEDPPTRPKGGDACHGGDLNCSFDYL